jgi:hypothetical protein
MKAEMDMLSPEQGKELKEEVEKNLETCLRKRTRNRWKKDFSLTEENLQKFVESAWPSTVRYKLF